MERAEILDRLIPVVRKALNREPEVVITPDMDLVTDLGADSMDIMEVVVRMEKEFRISAEDVPKEDFRSMEKLISLVQQQQADGRA